MRGGLAVMIAQARYWRRHRLQALLCLAGIVLGVAVFIAIRLATQGALAAFADGARALTGRATHRVIDPSGAGIPDAVFAGLRDVPGVRDAAPFMQRHVRVGERNVTVLGIDPLSDFAFRDFRYRRGSAAALSAAGAQAALLERFIAEPGAVLLPAALAAELRLSLDEPFPVHVAGGAVTLHVVGLFELPPERAAAFAAVMLVDVSTFQELFGDVGRLQGIDLILDAGAAAAVQARLPGPLVVEPAGRNTERVATMSRAFRLNLQALGLFALLVAGFLIFNAASFASVQRASQTAMLRCIGASRGRVLRAVLAEALLLGMAGGVAGVLLGRWLGARLVENTGATLFEVILNAQPQSATVTLDAESWAAGLALSLGTAFAGALWPALVSARIPPVAALRTASMRLRTARAWWWSAAAGALCTALALGLALWPHGSPLAGLAGASALALAGALFCPLLLLALGRGAAGALGRLLGPAGRMAARNLPRSGLSTAALMVALALALSIEITVRSFRSTFMVWMRQAVQADLYLAPAASAQDAQAAFSAAQIAALRRLPFVRQLAELRSRRVLLGDRYVLVVAVDTDIFFRTGYLPMSGADPSQVRGALESGAALVSEALARPLGLGAGDTLALPTPGGNRRLPIAAVVQNYSVPSGIVYLTQGQYRALFGADPTRRIGLWLTPGTDVAAAQAAIEAAPGGAELMVQPNALLRAEALTVFDRTFAITDMLAGLAAAVAFIAVVSALMSLLEERMRTLGYLRAIGMSARRVGLSMAVEGALMACAATVMAWVTGLLMSMILVFVVNPRAFGWSLQFHPEQGSYGRLLLVALVAALLGSLYPIRRATRLSVAATIREE